MSTSTHVVYVLSPAKYYAACCYTARWAASDGKTEQTRKYQLPDVAHFHSRQLLQREYHLYRQENTRTVIISPLIIIVQRVRAAS